MTILTTEQQVLDLSGDDVVILWRRDDWFIETDIYQAWARNRWQLQNPEDRDAADRDYDNAALWAIATLRSVKSTISVADGTCQITSVEDLAALPRWSVVLAGDTVFQWGGAEFTDMTPTDGGDYEEWKPVELWASYGASGKPITVIWDTSEAPEPAE